MQITPEIKLTILGSLSIGFIIMPIFFIVIDRLNKIIKAKNKQPQHLLEFAKVGVGAIVLSIAFVLPIELITRNIDSTKLCENCISVHMGTYAISSVISMIILYKTGRIQAIWRIPF